MLYEDRISSDMEQKALRAIGSSYEPSVVDASILVSFPYDYAGNKITMEHVCDEFTCLCPFSNLPDFAIIKIRYIPNKVCIELKSLKYYFLSFRQVKIFHEHAVNKILEDLVAVLDPIEMEIEAEFNNRGGIYSKAHAKYQKKN